MNLLKCAAAFVLGIVVLMPSAKAEQTGVPATIVVLGDSLSAGYGLAAGESFPEQLQVALDERGIAVKIVGAGVSGDTTSGGLARLDWSVPDGTDGVLIELGANDGLRGLPVASMKANLDAMITRLKERDIAVLLTGMEAAPNMGAGYVTAFRAAFRDLAQAHNVMFYPFFLDGVATVAKLNQADRIHPTAEGIGVVVEKILPTVERFVQSLRPSP